MNDSILLSVNELNELKQILKVNLESEKVVIFWLESQWHFTRPF